MPADAAKTPRCSTRRPSTETLCLKVFQPLAEVNVARKESLVAGTARPSVPRQITLQNLRQIILQVTLLSVEARSFCLMFEVGSRHELRISPTVKNSTWDRLSPFVYRVIVGTRQQFTDS